MLSKPFNTSRLIFLIALLITIVPHQPLAAEKNEQFDSADLRIRLNPRTPQQMAAFYEARGFGKAMINEIQKYCFITVYIRNKSNRIIWHDLNKWTFTQDGKSMQRINRKQLKTIWQSMKVPLAHQSTFRWTLLPEQLDFRPGEGEGGNIVLPWTSNAITIQAQFKTHTDMPLTVNLQNIYCKK